jgi:hypothetical protein
MDAVEREGVDLFQWILGPTIVIVSGYRMITHLNSKRESGVK